MRPLKSTLGGTKIEFGSELTRKAELMPQKNKSNVFIFEWPKIDIIVGKYLYWVVIIGWLAVLAIETSYGSNISELSFRVPTVSLLYLFPIFALLYFIFHIVISKFAFKVVLDFEHNTIESYMFHNKPIANKISELEMVALNWHTIFRYRDAKEIRTKANNLLIQMLRERNIPMTWGFFGKRFLKDQYREYME